MARRGGHRTKSRRAAYLAPRIRGQVYRSFKRIRPYNKGRLSLQSRLQSGGSLPMQTFARFYWRGSKVVDMRGSANSGNPMNSDMVFCMNNLQRPTYNGGTDNFSGTYSYEHVWRLLYSEALVLGSRMSLTIRKPMYPSGVAAVSGLAPTNPTIAPAIAVPADAMYGFWYMRVHYVRANDSETVTPGDIIGHDVALNDNILWANMRDFQQDASVSWKRDKLPKVTKMGNLFPSTAVGLPDLSSNPLYANSTNVAQQYYEVSYSNMPVRWSCKYSAKKHHMEQNILRNGLWQSLDRPATPPRLDPKIAYYVKFGYAAFDASGKICYTTPIDRIYNRQVEAEIQYFCALREPRVSPWNPPNVPFSRTRALELAAENAEFNAALEMATENIALSEAQMDEESQRFTDEDGYPLVFCDLDMDQCGREKKDDAQSEPLP